MNRLAEEKSPYLLQHADNPVDWYPWGEEAFETARKRDKPIFLSIGYSTCHWCHVMEHESFENTEVAELMNRYFISVKVDREERPDVDNIYMNVCQIMTGSGGWPLTILMTPDRRPFFAGTYFAKERLSNRPGMMELIPAVGTMWKNDRDRLLSSAAQVVEYLESHGEPQGTTALDESILQRAFTELLQRFDDRYGGFKGRNKFPSAHTLSFLLRYWKRTEDTTALHMVEKTLQEMRKGGIYDHIGLGFHRYATDPRWLVPHFEKMLYDQAMNALAYLEAYQATGNEEYARTARHIFQYVLRDMTSPEGGFYSAQDADSEGEEGKFYVWTVKEIDAALGEKEAQFFKDLYDIGPDGNFQEEATRRRTGRNIPYLKHTTAELAGRFGKSETKLLEDIERIRQDLFQVREKRVHPMKDDKILTDWNGLMIAALSKGAQALGDKQYSDAAKKAADFVLTVLRRPDGRLMKRYRQDTASLPAHLDDYAYFVWGLLELYEATFEVTYLQEAMDLNSMMIDLFWDENNGGFFFTANDAEEHIVRTKEIYDGAIPSGNSVAAMNLLRIARITANPELEHKVQEIGRVFSPRVNNSPSGFCHLLSAFNFTLGPTYEIVVVGDPGGTDTREMLRAVHQQFVPNKVVLFKSTDTTSSRLEKLAPFTGAQTTRNGKATAYVCQNYACKAPTTDPAHLFGR